MATWVAITEADIQAAFSGRELEAYRNAAKSAGEADPVAATISGNVELVRGYVAKVPRNLLGPEGTIPSCLVNAAVDMIVWQLMQRSFGDVVDPSGARKDAARAATDLLKDISRGEGPAILAPTNPVQDTRNVMPFAYSTRDEVESEQVEMTRGDQDGSPI